MRALSSVIAGRFRNHHPLGRALRRFLHSHRPLTLLPDCGWMDGGCLVLADALEAWSRQALRPGGALRETRGREFLDHAFTWLEVQGRPWIVDGDGLQTAAELIYKLEVLQQRAPKVLRFVDCSALAVGIPRDRGTSHALAELLTKRFGTSLPALLAKNAAPFSPK